ncbi:MAG TPA: cupin domain-containing protein [bacterium]|nr:cupin domain-containing protein [bacterium]
MPTRFVLAALRAGVDPTAYEEFIREYDYPVLPELRTIVHYRTHRIRPETRDSRRLPFDYIEQIVATDAEAYARDLSASPGFQRFREKNVELVDVDARLDFWAEVVPPAPLLSAEAVAARVFHRWEDVPEDAARPGLPLRRLQGKAMRAILVTLFPGVTVTPQHHPEEQLVHMLDGRLRLTVANETREIERGEVVLIPSDVPHTGEAVGGPAMYLEVLAGGAS